MAINKKLIHFKSKQKFNEELANGNILDTSIVFILDSKEIYTHGQYYGDLSECLTKYPQEFTKEEKDQMLENLGYYAVELDGVYETIELSDEEYRKVSSATNVYLVFMDGGYIFPTIKGNGIYSYIFIDVDVVLNIVLDTSTNPMTITYTPILIPKTTSELDNDSNFISSDNLKTINGESILGSGDIEVSSEALKFKNITASSWTADSTYTDFGYVCNLSCSGVTEDMYAEVVFDVALATSGNYAPVCETKANAVSVWSSEDTTITIPTIIITK